MPHSAKGTAPFCPYPTVTPQVNRHPRSTFHWLWLGLCRPALGLVDEGSVCMCVCAGVAPCSPLDSQLNHTKGCSNQKESRCWAGRSHGCRWLKGKVCRLRQLGRGGPAGLVCGGSWLGKQGAAKPRERAKLAVTLPTPQDAFCEWHQSTNRKGDAACSRRGRGRGALKSPKECPPLCSQ